MKKIRFTAALVGLFAVVLLVVPGGGSSQAASVYSRLNKIQKRILSGFASVELNKAGVVSKPALHYTRQGPLGGSSIGNYFPSGSGGCSEKFGSNVKANQNCLNLTDADLQGRGQAQSETGIAQDPNKPTHIVASSNDYRRGDSNCIGYYSLDNGATWSDAIPPIGFTRGQFYGAAREYWEGSGDTTVAWDTRGNAYLLCMAFQRGAPTTNNPDLSSAVFVFRSTGNEGASYNFPARPVIDEVFDGQLRGQLRHATDVVAVEMRDHEVVDLFDAR